MILAAVLGLSLSTLGYELLLTRFFSSPTATTSLFS